LAGTILGEDLVTTSTATVSRDMVAKAGSSFLTGTNFAAGSILGDAHTVSGDKTTTAQTELKLGSTIGSGSTLKENSTIGGELQLRAAVTLNQDMVVKAGSLLVSDTVLKAGTVLTQDLTDAQVGGGVGSGLKAGTTLGTDVTLTDDVNVIKDFTMIKGTSGTNASLAIGSKLAANGGNQNSVTLDNESFTNLSDIDVTTLEGAMKAIDTVSAAITNLDTIRSDIGSAQNQIVSTVNNISVTQVNVKAAESNIRDVDFAAESANFSKFNILAQSGSYAMSQANAVQQNVMRLLQ
jgi:flagellin